MATPFRILTTLHLPADFWEPGPPVLMGNPQCALAAPRVVPAEGRCFATSGSTGPPVWIRHTTGTLLASAAMVNEALETTPADVWLRALPLFHVGGCGVVARARLAGCGLRELTGKWNPAAFHAQLAEHRVTLTSLVPTQVYDLVAAGLHAPAGLRAVIVGGGHLPLALRENANALGWPLRESYGLTEAGSQVATEQGGKLTLLAGWQARLAASDGLEISGPALAIDAWREGVWQPLTRDGWFTTNDRMALSGRTLHWLGRSDALVKILGELVDLDAVQRQLSALAARPVVVVAVPDERAGQRLCAGPLSPKVLAEYHASCAPFARITTVLRKEQIVYSPLGKPLRAQTQERC